MSFKEGTLYIKDGHLSFPDLLKDVTSRFRELDSSEQIPKRKSSRLLDSLGFDTLDRRKQTELVKSRRFRSLNCLRSAFQVGDESSVDSLNTEDSDTEEDEILPEENQWMAASCNGDMEQLKDLLKRFPHLLDHKDFILGYTALHWASKLGRIDMVEFISTNHSATNYVDVKSHGGCTPLHLASMCGHDDVIIRLIELGANIHARDNNGKKPKDLVKHTVTALVQNKLGKSLVIDKNTVLESGVFLKVRQDTKSHRHYESPKHSPVMERKSSKSKLFKMGWK